MVHTALGPQHPQGGPQMQMPLLLNRQDSNNTWTAGDEIDERATVASAKTGICDVPPHPERTVSLISNLLQVSVRRRFTVGKALGHTWLQDFQLWCDLREFELRMGCRYLTHRGDEDHWLRYAQERGMDFPSHLCWDPDNELDM